MKAMKYFLALGFALSILFSTGLAADSAKPKSEKMVWFDGTGAYHYDDPVTYLNEVLSGEVNDKEVLGVLTTVCKGQKTVSHKQLPLIAAALDPLKNTFFLCYPDEQQLEANSKKIRDFFGMPSESTGSLTIKTFSFESRGDVSVLLGGTQSETLIALPADPLILKNATNELDKGELPLEKALQEGAKGAEWSKLAQVTQLPSGGTIYLFDLHPGPWVIYMDRGGLITQCYRVLVGTGHKNELVAERTCCPPRSKFTMKGSEDDRSE